MLDLGLENCHCPPMEGGNQYMTYSRQTTHVGGLRTTESMGHLHRRTPVCVLTAKIAVICRLVQFFGHFAQWTPAPLSPVLLSYWTPHIMSSSNFHTLKQFCHSPQKTSTYVQLSLKAEDLRCFHKGILISEKTNRNLNYFVLSQGRPIF